MSGKHKHVKKLTDDEVGIALKINSLGQPSVHNSSLMSGSNKSPNNLSPGPHSSKTPFKAVAATPKINFKMKSVDDEHDQQTPSSNFSHLLGNNKQFINSKRLEPLQPLNTLA